jgi:hypothetical protein
MQIADPKTHTRRNVLKAFAIQEFKKSNRCQILVSVATRAVQLVNGTPDQVDALIGDLEAVIIGSNMTDCRGRGAYFAGNISGASGFKPNLRDPYNQVQHATAGVVIGYRYGWLGHQIAKWMEAEPQDDRLYDATCQIGRSLNNKNYFFLPMRIKSAIGDKSC